MDVRDNRAVAKVRVQWVNVQKEFLNSIGFGKAFKSANKRFRRATFELVLSLNSWSRVLIEQGFRQYQVNDEGEFDGVPVGKKRGLMIVATWGQISYHWDTSCWPTIIVSSNNLM